MTEVKTEVEVKPTEPEVKKRKFLNGWTKEIEDLMAEWADNAKCFHLMHKQSEVHLSKKNTQIVFPVIFLSGITGIANFGLSSILGDDQQLQKYAQMAIGGVNFIAGLFTTVGNYYKFAQASETHKSAALSWGKFMRLIQIELRLHPNERTDCMIFLKMCRTELDRLMEQSPIIQEKIIKEFKSKYKTTNDVRLPDIANGITATKVYEDKQSRLAKLTTDIMLMHTAKKTAMKDLILTDLDRKIEAAGKRGLEETREKFMDEMREMFHQMMQKHRDNPSKAILSEIKEKAKGEVESLKTNNLVSSRKAMFEELKIYNAVKKPVKPAGEKEDKKVEAQVETPVDVSDVIIDISAVQIPEVLPSQTVSVSQAQGPSRELFVRVLAETEDEQRTEVLPGTSDLS
jgi:hypothetical protein